ncbi:MAG TPA: DNA glycosylase [Chthoniobacterales bacterium]|jgi:N-glycosylase/DNA lyase|nr:DNA glycosylase [Chthoniobacterales bacterium]
MNLANIKQPPYDMHDLATPHRQQNSRSRSRLDTAPAPDFSLEKTFNSGQVFHWTPDGKGFVGALGETPVYIEQEGDAILMSEGQAARIRSYLALDHPLSQIVRTFPVDPVMTAAAEYCRGLRIIRQPAWECLATFLTSALKQVQHIRSISLAIRKRFGRRLCAEQTEVFSYPSAGLLAKVPLPELLECKLGFRAANLIATAKIVASGELDLDSLHDLPTDEARRALCTLPGVGEKIANCVLLFAYERLDAVPIDVWISRVLRAVYFAGRTKVPGRDLRAFVVEYFGSYAGYAQQYLFHHWRLTYRTRQ